MELEFDASFAENPGGTGAGGVSASAVGSPPFVTAEQFAIRSVEVDQRSVQPGETVTVTAEYGSDFDMIPTRFDIDTDHPDYCQYLNVGFTFAPGADLYLEVESATTAVTEGGCWNVEDNTSVASSANVAAPLSPGTETIEVRLVGRNTGREYDSETVEIQVGEEAPAPPEPPEQPGEPPEQDNPLEDLFDSITFGTDSAAVPLVILVVILVALLYLTAI